MGTGDADCVIAARTTTRNLRPGPRPGTWPWPRPCRAVQLGDQHSCSGCCEQGDAFSCLPHTFPKQGRESEHESHKRAHLLAPLRFSIGIRLHVMDWFTLKRHASKPRPHTPPTLDTSRPASSSAFVSRALSRERQGSTYPPTRSRYDTSKKVRAHLRLSQPSHRQQRPPRVGRRLQVVLLKPRDLTREYRGERGACVRLCGRAGRNLQVRERIADKPAVIEPRRLVGRVGRECLQGT
eukprot:360343-Chlamydomonas_euryale.AAC.4